MPMAMLLVTYGRKKIVCKGFCKNLMEFKHTAIRRANTVETGTVIIHNRTVFFRHCKNFWYFTTF